MNAADASAFVTGVSGFVGNAIGARFKEAGLNVFGLARPGTKHPATPHTLFADHFESKAIAHLVREHRPRFLVHAAGRITPDETGDRGFYRDNLDMTLAIVEAVRVSGVPLRLICIGSAAQYGLGTPSNRATRETDALRPVSAYGASKAAALLAAHAAGVRHGLDVVSTVLFNLLGPGQPASFVPSTFITPAVADPAGTLQVGNIKAMRDFIDVRDAAAAVLAVAFKGKSGATYNAGSGKPTPIANVLGIVKNRLGGTLAWDADENRFGVERVPVSYADISAIRSDTGWAPQIDLAQSIDDMISVARERAKRVMGGS